METVNFLLIKCGKNILDVTTYTEKVNIKIAYYFEWKPDNLLNNRYDSVKNTINCTKLFNL